MTHVLDRMPALAWRGAVLDGTVERIGLLDLEVLDEFKQVLFSDSQVIELGPSDLFHRSLAYEQT